MIRSEFYFILVLYSLRLLLTTEILLKAMARAGLNPQTFEPVNAYEILLHHLGGTGSELMKDEKAKGSLKNNFTFWTSIHPVRLRCGSSKYA